MKKDVSVKPVNKNCFIYVRVSTTRQSDEGYSLDAQLKVCAEYAKKMGLHVKRIFREEGETATAADRPKFMEMIDRCEKGEVSKIIVYLTDRFARNETDHYIIKDKLKKCGVDLLSATQEMTNGDAPEAHLVDGIMASINAFYSRDNSRKTKRGMNEKFDSGVYPSWAPQGYKHIVDEVTKKHVIVMDEEVAPLINFAFELYAQGTYSIFSLCEELDALGLRGRKGKQLCISSLQIILTNTFYWGLMKWGGKEKMGTHTPIVEKPLFDKVQYLLSRHRSFLVRRRRYAFLLHGLIRCEKHDRRLMGSWHKVNSQVRNEVAYYQCPQRGGCIDCSVRYELLEKEVEELFKPLQFKQGFIDLVVDEAKKHVESIQANDNSKKIGFNNKIKALEQKRNNIEDMLVDGKIERDMFDRQHLRIQKDIDVLYRQSIDQERERGVDIKIVEEILELARNIHANYVRVPHELKRRYISLFFERLAVKDKKIAQVVYRPLFASLIEQQKEVILREDWLPRQDLNLEPCRYTYLYFSIKGGLYHSLLFLSKGSRA